MAWARTDEDSKHTPWIVLGGVAWLGVMYASLGFLPTYLLRNAVLLGTPVVPALIIACFPKSLLKVELTRFVRGWSVCMALYCLTVVACALLVLLGCSALGYLPYSDRPGPGWGNVPMHLPGLNEIGYFGDWAVAGLLPVCGFWGSVFFFFGAWSGWFGTPKWLIRAMGGVFCGFLAVLATAGAGWYIAIAVVVPNITGVAGVLFGALILPRFAGPIGCSMVPWKRAILVSFAALAVAASISYPFWRGRL
jgi:hypothetical protein